MYSMLNELLYINELFKLVSTFEHVDEIPKKKIQKVAIILDRKIPVVSNVLFSYTTLFIKGESIL